MNMKYKIKFHCKQPWQTRIEWSRQRLIPHDWHCSVDFVALSFSVFVLCGNWPCVIDIFSFARFLWIFSVLSVLAHPLKALFQETSLFSAGRRMPSHSNFFAVHMKEPRFLPNFSWSHMKTCLKYLNHFSNITRFPIDSSCIQHIR